MDRRVVGAFAVLLVACTKKQPDPVRAVPAEVVDATAPSSVAPAASAPVAAKADAGWKGEPPAAWTDPRVLDGLAADCDFVPPAPPASDFGGTPADLFRCTLAYEQSCVPDPCAQPTETCKTGCTDTCQSCDTTCATSCKSCKASCTDAACRRACATSCAECKQTCSRTMDRCVSGTCSHASDACNGQLAAAWKANGCDASCARLAKCRDVCSNGPSAGPDCWAKCTGNRDAKYDDCLTSCTAPDGCMLKCFKTTGCSTAFCETRTP